MKNINVFVLVCLAFLANNILPAKAMKKKKLNLSNRNITDAKLARRKFREGLLKINLDKNKLNRPNLSNLPITLEELQLNFNEEMISFDGIEHLTNLKKASFVGNAIEVIDYVPNSLINLSFSFNKISNFAFLEDLENLESLFLFSNKIKSLQSIPKLNVLKSLLIPFNEIQKIENLPEQLIKLDLDFNQIQAIENLPNSLENLSIASNKIIRVEKENLPSTLKRLKVASNNISDLSLCTFNDGLEDLDLANNRIGNEDLEFFDYPANLKKLRLERNIISNANSLVLHEGLEELNLKDNQLALLEELPKLPSTLKIINLKKNFFTEKEAKRVKKALRQENKNLKVRI